MQNEYHSKRKNIVNYKHNELLFRNVSTQQNGFKGSVKGNNIKITRG